MGTQLPSERGGDPGKGAERGDWATGRDRFRQSAVGFRMSGPCGVLALPLRDSDAGAACALAWAHTEGYRHAEPRPDGVKGLKSLNFWGTGGSRFFRHSRSSLDSQTTLWATLPRD